MKKLNQTRKWFAITACILFIGLICLPIVNSEKLPIKSKTIQEVILKEELQKNLVSEQVLSTEIIGKSGPPSWLESLFVFIVFMVPALLSLLPYALEDILEDLLE